METQNLVSAIQNNDIVSLQKLLNESKAIDVNQLVKREELKENEERDNIIPPGQPVLVK